MEPIPHIRPRSLAIALLVCLVLAAGTGGAVAASLVTGAQIKNGTITGKDIKNKSLKTKDLSPATVSSLQGQVGPAGVTGYQIVTANVPGVATGSTASTSAYCPLGKVALGGGSAWSGGISIEQSSLGYSFPILALRDGNGNIVGSAYPTATMADGWGGGGRNDAGAARSLGVWVICGNVT